MQNQDTIDRVDPDQIKYRGRRIDTKEFVYGSFVRRLLYTGETFCGYSSYPPGKKVVENVIINSEGIAYEIDPETLGQYTRMHDKNLVEIYEGDMAFFGSYISKIRYDFGTFRLGFIRLTKDLCYEIIVDNFLRENN